MMLAHSLLLGGAIGAAAILIVDGNRMAAGMVAFGGISAAAMQFFLMMF